MRKFGFAGAVLLALGALLLPTTAMAQCDVYPQCSEGGTVSDGSPRPGQEVTFSYFGGEGDPGSSFSVDFLSTPVRLGTFNFDSNGNFSVRVRIPSSATPGSHVLRAVGRTRAGGQLTVTAAVFISGSPLVPTGSNTLPFVLVGVGAIAVGGTFVGLQRRKAHKI